MNELDLFCVFDFNFTNLLTLLRCDPGFFGAFCEKSNTTLLNHGSFLFDRDVVEQINHLTYQGTDSLLILRN